MHVCIPYMIGTQSTKEPRHEKGASEAVHQTAKTPTGYQPVRAFTCSLR